jgi:hypothetical protein
VAPTLKQNIEAGKASGDWALGWRRLQLTVAPKSLAPQHRRA